MSNEFEISNVLDLSHRRPGHTLIVNRVSIYPDHELRHEIVLDGVIEWIFRK